MSESFKNRLAEMGDAWNSGKKLAHGLPDGQYNFQLQDAYLKLSTTDKLMICREHLVLDGEFSGEVAYDNLVLASSFGLRLAIQWLEKMGLTVPDDPEELEDLVAELKSQAPCCVGLVKSANDFTNVRITEMLEDTLPPPKKKPKKKSSAKPPKDPPADEEETAEEGDEDSPSFKKDDKVSFDDGEGGTVEGVVESVDGDEARVVDSEGEPWDVSLDELTIVKPKVAKKAKKKPKKKAKKASKAASDPDADLALTMAFAQSQDIEVADNMGQKEVTEALNEFSWPRNELTPEEVAAFERCGVEMEG